jgi:hypothetical protein
MILTKDFIGRNEKSRFTWNRENHRTWLSNSDYKKDSIAQQVAEGDLMATRFYRTIDYNGKRIKRVVRIRPKASPWRILRE